MKSFGEVTRDRLIERGTVTAIGNANWAAFVHELDGVSYETLRKAVTGERHPSVKLMRAVATALNFEPSEFKEFRLECAKRCFDPEVVGEDAALENLEAWSATQQMRGSHSKGTSSSAVTA